MLGQRKQSSGQEDEEQITCTTSDENNVPVYDREYWNHSERTAQTQKEIEIRQEETIENQLILKIDEEIQKFQDKFYRTQVARSNSKKTATQQASENFEKLMGNSTQILKQGYMNKKTDGIFFKWNKRYMVLTPEKFYSMQNERKQKVISCVNLKVLKASILEKNRQLILDFDGQCENMILRTQSAGEAQSWKGWLLQVLRFHQRSNKLMLQTLVRPIYDSKDTITERQFCQNAQTGDLLLFYTDNIGSKLQRMFTNSDFDHVAMVIRFCNGQLVVFEANNLHGVAIYEWKKYIRTFKLYKKVTLRKLNFIRKKEAEKTLLSFFRQNLGKKFDLSVSKLLTLESDFNWQNVKQDRGYFCSELVAKAFKTAGLLEEKKSSGRYWPVDFAEKSGLKLLNGASLGSQQSIILNKHIK